MLCYFDTGESYVTKQVSVYHVQHIVYHFFMREYNNEYI